MKETSQMASSTSLSARRCPARDVGMSIFLAGHADAAANNDQRVAIVQRVFHLRQAAIGPV